MKKVILSLIAIMGAMSINAQVIRVYKNGSEIFAYADADSIIFAEHSTEPVFSVSATNKVRFSSGNLQYNAVSDQWRFAPDQFEIIGTANSNISPTYNGWIDLFGWGTSGWSHSGAVAYKPTSTSTNYSDYIINNDTTQGLVGEFAKADWGVYNAIINGGNQAGLWRTMTSVEWNYLVNTRMNAAQKRGVACINDVNGLIILPDNYVQPYDVPFNSGFASAAGPEYYKTVNNYTLEQWQKMEASGAIFLPAAGHRDGNAVGGNINKLGLYWCSNTSEIAKYVHDFRWSSQNFTTPSITSRDFRYHGRAVRLVQDVNK